MVRRPDMKGKGVAVILDAMVALTFVILVATAFYGNYTFKMTQTSNFAYKNLHYLSEDVLDTLNRQGVLDIVGELWANESTGTEAADAIRDYLEIMIPPSVGYRVEVIENFVNHTILENATRIPEEDAVAKTHSSRLLVGYGAGLPIRGHVARAFLTNIKEKSTSEYVFFGGFVGQGNITAFLRDIPSDATVKQACLELNTPGDFDLYINDNFAESFTPSAGSMLASVKGSDGCVSSEALSYFVPGSDNKIKLVFTGVDLNLQYIGGGYMRVTFNTSEMDTDPIVKTERYWFSGIDGLINHYASFYVPGDLTSMAVHMEFQSNYSTFMTIGSTLIFNSSGSDSNQTIDVSDSNLSSILNYDSLSERTIPVRFGTGNVSGIQYVGNADVILITDRSGSMDRCVNSNDDCSTGCPDSDCRWDLALELDKKFVSIVLNSSGNRIGLVSYSNLATNRHDLSDNESSLNSTIDGFPAPSGGTCLCCAIREAKLMLENQSDPTRNKFVIVMTDGIANLRCDEAQLDRVSCCTDTGNCNSPYCGNGLYWSGTCDDYLDDTASENAVNDSCRANSEQGAVVHTIGFGSGAINCQYAVDSLRNISECGNGNYTASNDTLALEQIYESFAEEIINVSLKAQLVNVSGSLVESNLYPTSYIEYNFTSINLSGYGEISLTLWTDAFNDTEGCEGILWIPPEARVSDAKVTSYSSEHWTDYSVFEGSTVYRLWDYGPDYLLMGDPYVVQIPASLLSSGANNTVFLETGDSQTERTSCSPDNRGIYTLRIQSLIGYGNVFLNNMGCNWTIEFEDMSNITKPVTVEGYVSNETCYYTNMSRYYTEDDAISDSMHRLLDHLDLDDDGRVDFLFDTEMVNFEYGSAGGVQSLWGPVEFNLVVWI
ncbi:MAG: vWA domain-containing protein [Candidatus Altiarchaeota archaeon]